MKFKRFRYELSLWKFHRCDKTTSNNNGSVIHNETNISNDDRSKEKGSNTVYQIFMCLGPLVLILGVGPVAGFSAIFLPQFQEENEYMGKAYIEIESWIASSAVLPMPVSCFFGGLIMQKIGRKQTHILSAVPGILGWIIIYIAQSTSVVLIGRVLTGISCGILGSVTAVYIGEITSPSLRPFLLGCMALDMSLGTLYCQLIGTFYHWKQTALFCSIFSVAGGVLSFFSKESPAWLLSKNRTEEACDIFNEIRGESVDSAKELKIMLDRYEIQKADQKKSFCDVCSSLTKSEIFKPFIFLMLYFLSVQLGGINVITFYTIDILKMSLGVKFQEKHRVMLIIDCIRVITSVLACSLIVKLKRRQVAMIGGTGTFLSLLALSASAYKPELFPYYVPIIAWLGYVSFVSISLVPLPWCLAGELLPKEIKNLGSGILGFIFFSSYFVVVKIFPYSIALIGLYLTYLIFAGSVLFGTVLCLLFLPETKNKTLDEISEEYRIKKIVK